MSLGALRLDRLIEVAAHLGYQIALLSCKIKSHRLAKERIAAESFYGSLRHRHRLHNDESLAADPNISLCVDFKDFTNAAEELEKRVFKIRHFHLFVQILNINGLTSGQKRLCLNLSELLLQSHRHQRARMLGLLWHFDLQRQLFGIDVIADRRNLFNHL